MCAELDMNLQVIEIENGERGEKWAHRVLFILFVHIVTIKLLYNVVFNITTE